ncbi:unnamed protein product [Rotaria sp. Silwood2]|nr:unnamed protein product [Rotaria sp. Silwood2]CAF3445710.1 unnamed protein product [Rotaria sp. Silwood2]CAF4559301.1 unnamed protein product [Rotaria sp. Silwood2]CAF4562135.1 unnamed protein product [Rotaria sp. Silwood2]CAF4663586.1 unnamed protein product [Rotaria sp. Silwood2]
MLNNSQLPLSSSTNNLQSLTTSDNIPQRVTSPNLIPIIPSSDTNQLNSTLSTASSLTTITTDNNENIMQQSSSLKTKRQMKKRQIIESSHNLRESAKRTRRR